MTARARILSKLWLAAPADSLPSPKVAAHYAHTPLPTLSERLQVFRSALEAVQAQVYLCRAPEWPAQAAHLLRQAGVRRVLLDKDSVAGLALQAMLPPAMEVLGCERPLASWKPELFDTVDAGFSVAASGIAATGTLVLKPGPREPRSLSLVPPVHLVLLHADRLHADLYRAATTERWQGGMPSNLVLVSGPSKTSDIQQTVAYGAHGPRTLLVLVVVPDGRDEGEA